MKTCRKCGLEKPETDFWFDKRLGRHIAWCRPCQSVYRNAHRAKDPEKRKEKDRIWRLNNPESHKAAQERWKAKNPGLANERAKQWRLEHPQRHKDNVTRNNQQVKDACFEAYGGYVCACCGETEKGFLSLDHANNDGALHRREVIGILPKKGCGKKTYRWLHSHSFPPGIQVLCMNCNWGKRLTGVCPHKTSEGPTTRRKPYSQVAGSADPLAKRVKI